MKSFVTTTNITNGMIVTVTRVKTSPINYSLVFLAVIGFACLISGAYLFIRKPIVK